MGEKLYRYIDYLISLGVDEFGDSYGPGRPAIRMDTYDIIKRTPKGVWIEYPYGHDGKKFVRLTARKQFACETQEQALLSFEFRKKKQLSIYTNRAKQIETVLQIIGSVKNAQGNLEEKNRSGILQRTPFTISV